MIKKLFVIFFLCSLIESSFAQSKFQPEWNFGVGFGPTFSSMSFSQPSVNTKNYSQFHGGLSVRYITEKNVGIIGELNFIQEGWKGDYKDRPLYQHSHSLSYIDLPILTHIYFGNKVRFIINLGPKIQFLLDEKEEISQELANSIVNNDDGLVTIQYNRKADRKFDYGIIAGMGIEFRSGIGNFSLEGRYYFGLGDVYDNHKSQYNFSRSANRVISARLTYYVKLF